MARKKKLNVALIFGGTSQEREVSFRTAATMAKNLDPNKYDLIKIEIPNQINKLKSGVANVALLAVHGPGGEDGTIQGMLELLKIPYTFSGVLASSLAMDKIRTRAYVVNLGIKTPPAVVVYKSDFQKRKKYYLNRIRGKVVVKPNRIGSSLGITIVSAKAQLEKAIVKAFRYDDQILAEKFIQGTELTVPVLGNSKPLALPVIEIVPIISDFFDYKAKYAVGGTDEIVPARISEQTRKRIHALALKVHLALGCRGLTRSDFILDKNSELWFLEINTIPGLTPTSLVPKSAAVAGISYPMLLDKLIKLAIEKE